MLGAKTTWFLVLIAFLLLGAVGAARQGVGYLKVDAKPGRASVFVDGTYLGPAANFTVAQTYALAPGEHALRLSEVGHKDFTTVFTVRASETTRITQSLESVPLAQPPFGALRFVKGPHSKFAAVFVNDLHVGHVGEFDNAFQRLLLKAGEYRVKVISPDGRVIHEEAVTIRDHQKTVVRLGP